MKKLPLQKPPMTVFLRRLVVPSVFVWVMGFVAVGVFFQSPFLKGSTPLVLLGETQESYLAYVNQKLTVLESSQTLYRETFRYLLYGPKVCTQDTEVNDFQREQCREYYFRLGARSVISIFPFFLLGIFLTIFRTYLFVRYQRANRLLLSLKKPLLVKVIDPVPLKNDLFGFFHCVHRIKVECPDKSKAVAYYSSSEVLPLRGDKVMYASWGKMNGKKRYVATLQVPHIEIRKA